MYKDDPFIFIGTPMYGGMCYGTYAYSVIDLCEKIKKLRWEYKLNFLYNESLITRARNTIVTNFMETHATHLLFIDSDISFNPNHVLRMVEADKDIICGIYPKKKINWQSVGDAVRGGVQNNKLVEHSANWVVNFKNFEDMESMDLNKPVEIKNGGTGMMLIKRQVFEKLKDKVPHFKPADEMGIILEGNNDLVPEYFSTAVDPETKILLSEDYYFCELWIKNGGQVWAAPWVELRHTGTYVFSGKLQV